MDRKAMFKIQKIVDEHLRAGHGYELLWIGNKLLHGSAVSLIKRQIQVNFSVKTQSKSLLPQVCVDKSAFPFEDHSIDYVVLSQIFRRDQEPELCLKELSRILRQDGKLLIAEEEPIPFWMSLLQSLKLHRSYLKKIQRFLEREGWELEKRSQFHKGIVLLFQRKMLRCEVLKMTENVLIEKVPVLDFLGQRRKGKEDFL